MGTIMKINMYAEMKKEKNNKLNVEILEENILEYKGWLKKNNMEDNIENYERFLQTK